MQVVTCDVLLCRVRSGRDGAANPTCVFNERVADAPDPVGRLRRSLLDLAVRGRLVEQDPADDPASELLKRIAAAKTRLS